MTGWKRKWSRSYSHVTQTSRVHHLGRVWPQGLLITSFPSRVQKLLNHLDQQKVSVWCKEPYSHDQLFCYYWDCLRGTGLLTRPLFNSQTIYESIWNIQRTRRQICPTATLSSTNPTWSGLDAGMGTNCLSYGTTSQQALPNPPLFKGDAHWWIKQQKMSPSIEAQYLWRPRWLEAGTKPLLGGAPDIKTEHEHVLQGFSWSLPQPPVAWWWWLRYYSACCSTTPTLRSWWPVLPSATQLCRSATWRM